ncbi:PAS domain-containing sensor histidine kinase [Rhodoferax sp.]|uniref:PAS domain-containing sensor histidine kinase n=1 Tax=Rhodoferax sp. TaxID=50421 RepID=UPI002852A570|nr:PAS domain-containing sensor histidine kinase [Rhodoferax sp.]
MEPVSKTRAVPQAADNPAISSDALKALRRRAEDSHQLKVKLPLEMVKEMKSEDAQMLFHELRVHQIELELQNEELRRAQVELDAARERYFDLYDMAPVGYCTVDESGRILEANLTAARMLGLTRMALVKQKFTRFMANSQQPAYLQCCAMVRVSGQTQSCDLLLTREDGQPMWISLAANLAKGPNGSTTMRVTFKDITDRVALETALKEQNLELERTRALADKANRAKSDFLSSMSHELRSPLNAILGFAQLMEAGKPAPTPAQKSAIDQIIHGGWYLLDLVNEILDLASIESGRLALTMAPESLAAVLLDCQTMIEPQATAQRIPISFPTFEQPCMVQVDRRRLKQVVINLLSNAIKYNRKDGTVTVSWSLRPHKTVRISVQDTGQGLAAEQMGHLFQPFNRLGQELGPLEGTGIGLVVSKRLVEMMGGTIGVHSTLGEGSVFWFEVALAKAVK